MNAASLQRQIGYYRARLGPMGLLGVALLLLAVLTWFGLVRSGENEILRNQHKIEALKQQQAAKSSLPASSALNREEQLRVFYASFATAEKLPDTLKRIYQAAEKQGLVLETGEYTRVQAGAERLARFRVSLPVKGSFRQVLGLMDTVLQENNTVALENVAFKRDKVDDEAIEAKVVFLVFMDAQP
jgi:Tfp pilus assembly protein PilO